MFRFLLSGEDSDVARIYHWHIWKRSGKRLEAGLPVDGWKRSLDDYTASAASLCRSMAYYGFRSDCPIPVDPNGELLGGAHRLACALALGIEQVAVSMEKRFIWAPDWSLNWFAANGMANDDYDRLCEDWKALNDCHSR